MTIEISRLPVFGGTLLALMLGTVAWGDDEPNEITECDVFIEINAEDEDAGWQGILDASPWRSARVLGPGDDKRHGHKNEDQDKGTAGKTFLDVDAKGNARKQGITEYSWESAEPTFEDFALADFLERFPAGTYTCNVKFIDGHPRRAKEEDELTHCLPEGPLNIGPVGELPADTDWTVSWDPVTTQYDQDDPGNGDPLGECDPEDALVKYTVTVEFENGDDKTMNFDVIAPDTSVVVSGDFLECGLEGKAEIGAVLESGNATFREAEISTSDCP